MEFSGSDRAKILLAYYVRNQFSATFKFWALSGLVEYWARAFGAFKLKYCCRPSIKPWPDSAPTAVLNYGSARFISLYKYRWLRIKVMTKYFLQDQQIS